MGNLDGMRLDNGGISPADVCNGISLTTGEKFGVSATDLTSSLAYLDDTFASLNFLLPFTMNFVAAACGVGTGFRADVTGNLDLDSSRAQLSNLQTDVGMDFGMEISTTASLSVAVDVNYGFDWLLGSDWVGAGDYGPYTSPQLDLIPIMKGALAFSTGIKFNAQEVNPTIYSELTQSWGFVEGPDSGDTATVPISFYADLIDLIPGTAGLKALRLAIQLLGGYFTTGPGLSATYTATWALTGLEDPATGKVAVLTDGVSQKSLFTAGEPPKSIRFQTEMEATYGWGISWITTLGVFGLFDRVWQPTLDTEELFPSTGTWAAGILGAPYQFTVYTDPVPLPT